MVWGVTLPSLASRQIPPGLRQRNGWTGQPYQIVHENQHVSAWRETARENCRERMVRTTNMPGWDMEGHLSHEVKTPVEAGRDVARK